MTTVINERLGGHYMDVGAGKMITSGQVSPCPIGPLRKWGINEIF
jgi:hypothetical protein